MMIAIEKQDLTFCTRTFHYPVPKFLFGFDWTTRRMCKPSSTMGDFDSVRAELLVLRRTDKAFLVQVPDDKPRKTAWIPASKASCGDLRIGWVCREDRPCNGQFCYSIHRFTLQGWLYKKLYQQLNDWN